MKSQALFIFLAVGGGLVTSSWGVEPPSSAALLPGANPLGLTVDHQTLGVADLQKEAAWYQRVLGFTASSVDRRPAADYQQLSIPGFFLDLIAKKGSTRPTSKMTIDMQGVLALTFGTKDLEAANKRLVAEGVEIRASRDAHDKLTHLHIFDPEGNALEIALR